MNDKGKMPMNSAARNDLSSRRCVRLPILVAAMLIVISTVFTGSGLTGTAQAQAERGAIPSVSLDSNEPGQLVITRQTPDPAPTDYRISWAHSSLGFLSYRDSNEAQRGNAYPSGNENTLTLDGLTPGEIYKVQLRARYYTANRSAHEWSGPWTGTSTTRVMDEPAKPPPPEETPQPAEQTENDDPPAAPTGLTVARVGHSVLTLTWDDPQDERITGYRVLRGASVDSLSTIEENTGGVGTEYADDTVAPETTYHYAVIALSAVGDGAQSDAVSATTTAPPKPKKQPTPESARQSTTRTDAQTVTTFISNTGQTSDFASNSVQAVAFTTGTGTYTLSSVGIVVGTQGGSSTPAVKIYGDTGGNPGTLLATMTNPGTLQESAVNSFTAPANTTLSASTTYWLVTSNSAATNGEGFQVGLTNKTLDSGTAVGWSLGNARSKMDIAATSWTASNFPLRFAIRGTSGTTTNNPPTVANAIPDQSATAGTAFSYAFPDTTFSDADTGDTLSYTATKADGTVSDTFDITVIISVPADWSLKPTAVAAGAREHGVGPKFRLLFLSSTKRDGSSTDIATYNTFIQTRVAAGHIDIRPYSAGFRVVGCTAAVDARDNTQTTYTTTDEPVPIYWLNGAKAADQYEDFYDGSWDDEANDKNESGTNGPDTSQAGNYPLTGCDHDGTAEAALGASQVTVGRPNSSGSSHGPLNGNSQIASTVLTRPMYGLSAVFQVAADTTPPTLTGAYIDDTDGLIINLEFSEDLQLSNPPPASAFTVTVDGSAATVSSVGVPGSALPQNALWLQLSTVITQGQAVVVAYADPTTGHDANAIQDAAGNDAHSFTTGLNGVPDVINNVLTEVPNNWSLKPTGLNTGDQFRLLFLSSTKRDATATDIATYNTFVQTRAAAGHTDIQDYSAGFRAVGCTADTDARDNTKTTYTTTDKGVPIYWLDGAKAADEYQDFYDGSWDDEVNDKNESGTNGLDTSQSVNRPFTGCEHNGTEALDGSISQGFGAVGGTKVGRPNSSSALHGPLSSNAVTGTANTRPMYGLSAVFQVAAAVVVPNNPPAFSADTADRSVPENTAAAQDVGAVLTATDADSDTLTYTLEGTDAASFDIVSGSGQIRTRTGVTYNHEAKSTHTVIVKADDGNGGTDTITVTITVTDVDEPPGIPAAPTVSATAGSTTSLNVAWVAPTNTGPAIASYDLQYREGASGNFTNGPQNVTGTSAAIGSLAADTSYEVQVRATNAEGDGDWSVAGTGRTTATSAPGAPTGLTATASGATQIDLSWTAPASTGGSAITGYKIEVSSNGGSSWTDQVANTNSTATTYAHTGLAAGDTRHYRVSAINANGSGTASNVDSATTATTVPGAPTGLTATASGSTQINLSWTAPAITGGSAITGYKIEVSSDGGSSWSDQVANTNSTATTYAHTGLTAGTTRHYRVSAINTNGSGTASNVDSATTGTTVPGAPTGLTATASGATQITLSWTAPGSTGGSAITGYNIEVSSDGGSSWSDLVANTSNTTTTYQHTGLTAPSTRHYRVSAINANGSGTASNVDSATTGTTVPGAPSGLSATASGSTRINLSWSAPASTGGSAITGYKIEVSSNGGSSWTDQVANTGSTTTTYAHTGLAPGSTRHYRVSAINTNGSGTASNVDSATTGQTTVTFATLSALTVSPKDIIGFVADRTSYEVGVASTVTQATITATKSHSAATVAYSTTDADTSAGHQVNLSDGRNEVTITVTAEDTTTTGTYTVSINRGVTDAFGWKASDDFDGLITAENNRPRGMWSDGTTMWVTDWIDIKIYAYDMTTKAHDASKDFDTLDAAGNDNPRGIWSDGTTVWVSDYSDEKLYAYDMTTKARDVSKDFDTANLLPTGIWSDGTTMWVAAQVRAKIYAYDMSTKARDADKDFDTLEAAGNNYPGGIWSNNITMWVAEEDDEKLYAYNMASKARDADKDFNTLNAAGNGETGGIWANTNTMWASDTIDYKIYSYNMPLIAPNIPAAGTPAVTAPNVFRVPAVLSADLTDITDTDGVTGIATTATYKWQRFAANGTTLDTDSVGTGSTYTLTDADAGKTLKVVVSFTDNGGNSEGPLTSAATSAITAAAICAAPSLTGGATFLGPARKLGVGRISLIGSLMYGYSKASGKGSLDNARFTTAASNNYEIVVITNSSSILVEFDTALTADDRSTLVVHICDQAYAFSSSDSFIQHEFTTPLQNWAPHAERTIYLSQDTAASTFASATVNGTSLVITLSEPLGAAASLANSAFTVKKGPSGSQTTLTLSGTAPVISGSTVTLTLAAASTVSATDTNVLVTYTKPGTGTANKLVDAFGNETGTFADQVVTNLLSTTVPGAPSGLSATASGSTRINLSWTAPAITGGSAITGYKIEVSSNGGSSWTDLVANTSSTATTYAHTGLASGSTRHYRVSAINANGSGTASNVDSATTATTVPGAPTGLTATASGSTRINLSWSAPAITGGSAITGYKIEVSLQRDLRLDRPGRQHQQHRHDLRAHGACLRQYPPLPRLRHQRQRRRHRLQRRQRHHRHHRARRSQRPHGNSQREHPDQPLLERSRPAPAAPPSPATRSRSRPTGPPAGPTRSPTPTALPPPTRTPG